MKIIEQGLIPVYEENSRQVVNARELHEFLEVGTKFADWIKGRIDKYGFTENEDFIVSEITEMRNVGATVRIDYILSIDTAKEIAMVENNEKGRTIRKYFIEVEKRVRQPKQMTQAEILASIAQFNVDMERKVIALDSKITNALDVFTAPPADDWRHDINNKINQMCINQGLNHQTFRHVMYQELEITAKVDLLSRQTRARLRMKTEGATVKEREAISKLDIIDRDPKLRAIFEGIVRKYQAKYVA